LEPPPGTGRPREPRGEPREVPTGNDAGQPPPVDADDQRLPLHLDSNSTLSGRALQRRLPVVTPLRAHSRAPRASPYALGRRDALAARVGALELLIRLGQCRRRKPREHDQGRADRGDLVPESGRSPRGPLRVPRDLLQPRAEALTPRLREPGGLREACHHAALGRITRVSTKSGESQAGVSSASPTRVTAGQVAHRNVFDGVIRTQPRPNRPASRPAPGSAAGSGADDKPFCGPKRERPQRASSTSRARDR